ncbi:MAG: ROK family protein [Bacteroidales bacterium]|nr:ROK family protein [Bacteroidales bacterium]
MADLKEDKRIVLTLDAGGTNMVFGAIKGGKFIGDTTRLPSNADNLGLCLETMVKGFSIVRDSIKALGEGEPAAISFSFPGPADYPNGIIGGFLPNFPSFREGVALGPFLKEKFGIPVFINNDGDLYAYGEAIAGALPEINARLEAAGSAKRYRNLIGYTFGTGFGVGIVMDGRLNRGDNSCVETFCLEHPFKEGIIVEEGVAARAVKRVYGELSGNPDHGLDPKGIGEICTGDRPGDKAAALAAFNEMGEVAGRAMATAASLIDGLIVIGGGIMHNSDFIMPGLLKSLRSELHTLSGETVKRVQSEVFNLDDPEEFAAFAKGQARSLKVWGTDKTVVYDPMKRIGVMRSKIGASEAISLGAYLFALSELDK